MTSSVISRRTLVAGESRPWLFQSDLKAVDRSHGSVPLNSLGTAVMLLLTMAAAAYAGQAFMAVVTGRHLYWDTSWFLVKLLSERHIAVWNAHGWRDFFVGRFGTFAYQETPTLLAMRLRVRDPHLLSLIYGVTLFSFKPLGLLLCYRFARDKRLVIFPLLTLFAGTMNSEASIGSETHLMSALFWPALFGLMYCREFKGWVLAAMIAVSAPLLVCYETMAMLGLFLCAACIYRLIAVARGRRERWLSWVFFGWYSLGVIFGALAIAFPRDATNRSGFLKSTFFFLHADHIGARVSVLVLLLCAAVVLIPERCRRILNTLTAIGTLGSLAIPLYIILHPQATNFGTNVVARTMHASVCFVLALAFIALHFHLLQVGAAQYKRLFVMAAVLGICQSGWSLVASSQWSNMLTVLRAELRTHAGAVALEDTLLVQSVVDGQPIRELHADWPLMSLSILYSDNRTVRTIVFADTARFLPFDPYDPGSLPNLHRFGFSYAPYVAALAKKRSGIRKENIVPLSPATGSR